MARPRQELAYLDAEVVTAIVPGLASSLHALAAVFARCVFVSRAARRECIFTHPFFQMEMLRSIGRERERERASGVSKGFFRPGWRGSAAAGVARSEVT